jgi:hypothetical protein
MSQANNKRKLTMTTTNETDNQLTDTGREATSLLSPTGEELSPKQILALNALVSGKRIHEAAVAAGVNRRTLTRWLQSPLFRAAFNAELKHLSQQASRRSALVTIRALDALDRIIASGEDPALVIKAALAVFQHRPPPIEYGPITPQDIAYQNLLNQLTRTIHFDPQHRD